LTSAQRIHNLTSFMHPQRARWRLLFFAAIVFGASWYYYSQVFIPVQNEKWAREQRPLLNHSDFFPRWHGAKEFLLHGRNPYSSEITAEIQMGFYGRKLDPNRSGEWRDQQRFAYPLYAVLFLAPTVKFPFETVRPFLVVFLLVSSVIAIWAWFRAVGVPPDALIFASAFLLYFGNWQAMEAIHLHQLSLAIAALIAVGVAAYVHGRFALSGVLLGLAMIKPQLAIPFVGWLGLCALSRWYERRWFVLAYASVFGLLLLAAQVMMPGWFWHWRDSARAYVEYVDANTPILTMIIGKYAGIAGTVAIGVAAMWICWRLRKADTDSPEFRAMVALVACCTVVLPPVWHYYDQVLLLPAVALAISALQQVKGERRVVLLALVAIFASSWIASPLLLVLHWLKLISPTLSMTGVLFPIVLTPVSCVAIVFILVRIYTRRAAEVHAHESVEVS
jgi:hypothetical protein